MKTNSYDVSITITDTFDFEFKSNPNNAFVTATIRHGMMCSG